MLNIIKHHYLNIRDRILRYRRKPYLGSILKLIGRDTSIICTNCFGGRIMQDIGMKYNTPTLGLFFVYPDYIEFLSNLKYYLTEAKLSFTTQSRYQEYNELRDRWPFQYPIGVLDDKIEIHFLHYHSNNEAKTKWIRRSERINWDKLLIVGMDQNRCTENDIKAFDRLSYRDKVFFSSKPIEGDSIIFMKEFEKMGKVGDPYKKGHVFYKYLVNHLSNKPL